MDKAIKQWHDQNKTNDYLDYKCKLVLQYFTYDELEKALIHLYDTNNKLRYPLEDILKTLKHYAKE